jgi:hypothetical protein
MIEMISTFSKNNAGRVISRGEGSGTIDTALGHAGVRDRIVGKGEAAPHRDDAGYQRNQCSGFPGSPRCPQRGEPGILSCTHLATHI